ncbi:MAG: hypothetical protein FWE71_07040 [Nocardioidaceae bacterium]|nr:hypothetical protein [Nocardioidaceae bacterium]MCL2612206.1 hypothetical protein [Nocardioidaceae bacterium]
MRLRVGAAATVAAVALLGGCALPASITGKDQAGPRAPLSSASASGDGGGAGVPSDASSLASAAQEMATRDNGTGAPADSPGVVTDPSAMLGGDISWPQCPPGMGIPQKRSTGQPMPLPDAEFVVVGLTDGPGFVANPCLKSQVQWVKVHRLPLSAYSVVSYPDAKDLAKYGADGPYDPSTLPGRLKNVGYQEATYNVGSMGSAGLNTPLVWLDVESVPDFDWPANNTANNAAVVQGEARGYKEAGYAVGVYGTPTIWKGIVGGLTLGGNVPEWRAAGQTSQAEATIRCGSAWSIQGGQGVLGQWVEERRDRNLTCPGAMGDLSKWFDRG